MQLIGHINEDQVMALYLGELSGDEEQRMHRHVSDCPGCNREFLLYREILGGVETLISHPASMTHASVPPEQRAVSGITDGLVRVSVGIEEIDDLIADCEQALGAI